MVVLEKTLATPEIRPDITTARLSIELVDPEKRILKLAIARGYNDSGTFKLVDLKKYTIVDDDYDTIFNTEGETGIAVRVTLATAIWTWVEANTEFEFE